MSDVKRKSLVVLVLGAGLLMGSPLGCAERVSKVETTTAVVDGGPGEAQDGSITTTETTTSESEDSSPGIIGSAFGFVWAVISFPFRVIGALF